MLEADTADLTIEGGVIRVVGSPGKSLTVGQAAGAIYFASEVRPPDIDPTLEATASFDPDGTVFSNGAHAAIVNVDVETGVVRVETFYAVEDCGVMINPAIVEGQIRGGIAQAIGGVLLEEMVYNDDGQLLTTTFMDYLLPTASEVPPIEIVHLSTPSKITPGGIKGMGESAMVSAPAAIVNGVNDALAAFGVMIEELPITPDRVLAAVAAG